jgi:hypothetical protein
VTEKPEIDFQKLVFKFEKHEKISEIFPLPASTQDKFQNFLEKKMHALLIWSFRIWTFVIGHVGQPIVVPT